MADTPANPADAAKPPMLASVSKSKWKKSLTTIKIAQAMRAEGKQQEHKKHQNLIQELASHDGQLGAVLRSVYDSCEREAFRDSLERYIEKLDGDIEVTCNFHYQGFVETVEELLKVRADASTLRTSVSKCDSVLQESGGNLLESAQALLACRQIQRNVVAATEALTACVPLLALYDKALKQIQNDSFYPALRSLEAIEIAYLPSLPAYSFTRLIKDDIPRLREHIRTTVFNQLHDWLSTIRELSRRVGVRAIGEADAGATVSPTSATAETAPHSSVSASTERRPSCVSITGQSSSADLGAEGIVDYKPVYRCMHIYSVLGKRSELESEYREARRNQAQLVLAPLVTPVLEGFREHFHDVLGFFIVESTIIETAQTLSTRAIVNELWDIAMSQIRAFIQLAGSACSESRSLLDAKTFLVVFCRALQARGFNTTPVMDMVAELRDRYVDLLMEEWTEHFLSLLAHDPFDLYTVNTESDLRLLRIACPALAASLAHPTEDPLGDVGDVPPCSDGGGGGEGGGTGDDGIDQATDLPYTFVWSRLVVDVYAGVRQFAADTLRFVDDLNVSFAETDVILRRAVNELLSGALSNAFLRHVEMVGSSLNQLVQLMVNASALATAFASLEGHLAELLHTEMDDDDEEAVRLVGVAVFRDHRRQVEQTIQRMLSTKVDEFAQLMDYQWLPPKPITEPSGWLVDLSTYLSIMFQSMRHFPEHVARHAYFHACSSIARHLLTVLVQPTTINRNAFAALSADVNHCVQFANECPVDRLAQTFGPLEQTVSIFHKWDFDGFCDDQRRPLLYPSVEPRILITLLEKFRSDDPAIYVGQNNKAKKKLLEALLRRLRSITSSFSNV